MALTTVWNREQFTLPRLVYNDTPAMNELVAESCAVVSSIFCTFLAERMVRLRDTMTKKRRQRRWWVREWILRRGISGATNLVDTELKNQYADDFKNLLRMTEDQFEYLLQRVGPLISKSDTNMRKAISAKTKLEVTLWYVAAGDSFKNFKFSSGFQKT